MYTGFRVLTWRVGDLVVRSFYRRISIITPTLQHFEVEFRALGF